jgi:uncharacterized protein
VFFARGLRARTLLALGLTVLAVGSLLSLAAGLTMGGWPPEAVAEYQSFWSPSAEALEAETAAFGGPYMAQLPWRAEYALEFQTFDLLVWGLWRAGGLMLLGMALFKTGVLAGTRTPPYYAKLTAVGFGIGLPLVGWGLYQHHATGWNMRDSFFLVAQWNYWGSILVSLGWIGLLLTLRHADSLRPLCARLSAAGRMAFSCYIFETLISTLVFYGHGLGWFGSVDRLQQMLFTVGVWLVILIVAPLWLARFQYGPLEWLWRSLTYGRAEPFMRRERAVTHAV